jgi:hypothetical protein
MSGDEGAAYAVQIMDASFKLCLQKTNAATNYSRTLEIERRLIISTEGVVADESHDQLRGDISMEQVALTVDVLYFRQGSDQPTVEETQSTS